MLAEALIALASTGGTALVTAMVTDSWEGIRTKAARLFGRGDKQEAEAALARLEQSRAALTAASGAELERAKVEQEIIWRTRLADLLEREPSAEPEVRNLVTEIQQTVGSTGDVTQSVVGYDHAQQAVQGHGVQNVTFGDQRGSAT